MELKDLTPEQQEKAMACKTPEEFIAFAKEMGYELSEDELEALSGGEGPEWIRGTDEACCFYCTNLGSLCQSQF